MNLILKKLLSVTVASIIVLSSANLVSATETDKFPESDVIPDGYSIIKQYDINSDSSKVASPLQLVPDKTQQNTFNKNSLLEESATESTYISNITNNETHLYRELKNINNGELMKQYVTDISAAAVPGNKDQSDTQKDSKSDVTVTIRMFYHAKNKDGNTYYGLDKIYYRYEGTPDRSRISAVTGGINQQGPGINGSGQLQSTKIQPQYGLEFGKTILIDLSNKGWVEVLDGGLLTQMGIELVAGISNSGVVHEFRSPFFITGRF
ncbi:hypothetical protein [Paenibacillus sp. Z6-24]